MRNSMPHRRRCSSRSKKVDKKKHSSLLEKYRYSIRYTHHFCEKKRQNAHAQTSEQKNGKNRGIYFISEDYIRNVGCCNVRTKENLPS